jgi:cell division protein FtsX
MKSAQQHLNQQAALAETLHRIGRTALFVLAIAAALIIANTALTAALALPETLNNPQKW